MPKCTILIGVPASGKTTWRAQQPAPFVLSSDDIIESMAAARGQTYNEVFTSVIGQADKAFWIACRQAANKGLNVIIDRTNMSRKARARYFEIFKGYDFEALVFPTPDKDEWKRRLSHRPGKTIPQHVLDNMNNSYEAPTREEGFTTIGYVDASVTIPLI